MQIERGTDCKSAPARQNLIHAANKNKIQIILSGVNEKVHDVLTKNGIEELLGAANVCNHISLALARAEEIINKSHPVK